MEQIVSIIGNLGLLFLQIIILILLLFFWKEIKSLFPWISSVKEEDKEVAFTSQLDDLKELQEFRKRITDKNIKEEYSKELEAIIDKKIISALLFIKHYTKYLWPALVDRNGSNTVTATLRRSTYNKISGYLDALAVENLFSYRIADDYIPSVHGATIIEIIIDNISPKLDELIRMASEY